MLHISRCHVVYLISEPIGCKYRMLKLDMREKKNLLGQQKYTFKS